jgi:hypothetical protein
MLVPLALLSLGAVFAGFVFHGAFLENEAFWNGAVAWNEHLMHAMHEVPLPVKLAATIVMVIGFAIAWIAYIRDTSIPAQVANQLGRSTARLQQVVLRRDLPLPVRAPGFRSAACSGSAVTASSTASARRRRGYRAGRGGRQAVPVGLPDQLR